MNNAGSKRRLKVDNPTIPDLSPFLFPTVFPSTIFLVGHSQTVVSQWHNQYFNVDEFHSARFETRIFSEADDGILSSIPNNEGSVVVYILGNVLFREKVNSYVQNNLYHVAHLFLFHPNQPQVSSGQKYVKWTLLKISCEDVREKIRSAVQPYVLQQLSSPFETPIGLLGLLSYNTFQALCLISEKAEVTPVLMSASHSFTQSDGKRYVNTNNLSTHIYGCGYDDEQDLVMVLLVVRSNTFSDVVLLFIDLQNRCCVGGYSGQPNMSTQSSSLVRYRNYVVLNQVFTEMIFNPKFGKVVFNPTGFASFHMELNETDMSLHPSLNTKFLSAPTSIWPSFKFGNIIISIDVGLQN
eukprot:TRINITY_DN5850_c0_g2_i4.p1 TRINITY_DN5850_c0_g2~~TRINITY_DN5850_c0_g2_i4.p1  ORF type:complete len:353 (-),score=45.22 TRINITY_DN5850_c0_g2_i4:558-1616(-)